MHGDIEELEAIIAEIRRMDQNAMGMNGPVPADPKFHRIADALEKIADILCER
ncbi:MAG: hypothetical protein KF742_01455 [Cryobacterium sp.]|nr:hypothetical protein [Cryobacterium sp.]MBX3116833.1 hypothetical protein [Cryobacterium sp.]MCO5293719.1 hypothetical protein [Homoserinimonas sp.]MCW5944510.1 hypothetical protein [Cryobacterium sp.]